MIIFVMNETERGIQIKTQSELNKVATVHIVFLLGISEFFTN